MPAEHIARNAVDVPSGGKVMIAEFRQMSSQIGLIADQEF